MCHISLCGATISLRPAGLAAARSQCLTTVLADLLVLLGRYYFDPLVDVEWARSDASQRVFVAGSVTKAVPVRGSIGQCQIRADNIGSQARRSQDRSDQTRIAQVSGPDQESSGQFR